MKYVDSQFYCLNCGSRGLDCLRKEGKIKKTGHRKKMWCFNCQQVCNFYEVHNKEEEEEFRKKYKKGVFAKEAEDSIKQGKKDNWWWFI